MMIYTDIQSKIQKYTPESYIHLPMTYTDTYYRLYPLNNTYVVTCYHLNQGFVDLGVFIWVL